MEQINRPWRIRVRRGDWVEVDAAYNKSLPEDQRLPKPVVLVDGLRWIGKGPGFRSMPIPFWLVTNAGGQQVWWSSGCFVGRGDPNAPETLAEAGPKQVGLFD